MKRYSAGLIGGGVTDISQLYERNQEATIYVGNLDLKVDEELLCELFTQCGPIKNINIPRDKITSLHSNYGFVEYENEIDAEYAIKILNMIKLFGKPIRCNKASQDKRTQEVGANLFVGNLDIEVDEKLLYDTFSSFGQIMSAKVMRDAETGCSKGYGFVSYDSFESSDACLVAMNGQFLCNRPIHVSYAYKKDTKGERHGSAAERLIAANRPMEKIKPLSSFLNFSSNAMMPGLPNFGAAFINMPGVPPSPLLGGLPGVMLPSSSGASQPMGGSMSNSSTLSAFSTNTAGGGIIPPVGGIANMSSAGRIPRQDTLPSNFMPNSNAAPPPFNISNFAKHGGSEAERALEGNSANFPAPPSNVNRNVSSFFLGGVPPLPAMNLTRMPPPFGGVGGIPGIPPGNPPPMFFPLRPGMSFPPGMPPLPNTNLPNCMVPPLIQNTRNQQ